jgi:hypothetical protein
VRRGNTTTSQTRGLREAEREAMAQHEVRPSNSNEMRGRVARRWEAKCATGWLLDCVKIVLLLFQCRYPEQSLPSNIN